MNDIVTRLKWLGCQYDHSCITCEAADEIERLRADRDRWRNWAVDYAYDDEKCECDRCFTVRTTWEATPHGG